MIDLAWLDDGDAIKRMEWERTEDEIDGSTPDMCWVRSTATRKRALFKPDTLDVDGAYREYATYKVAKHLGIASAKIEVGTLFGKFGCISYDCNIERRHRVADGDSLYRCDTLFNNKRTDTNDIVYDSPIELSFTALRQYITHDTEMELLNMMFLDCLMLNPDRHGGNYSFYINRNRAISGLMALYDHGLCMRGDLRDVSLFPYEGRFEPSFHVLFNSMALDYPDYIASMLEKVKTDDFTLLLKKLGCVDFILNRISRFEDNMRM